MTYPETAFYGCHKCTIRFALVTAFGVNGETTRCSVPNCNHRFWHGYNDHVAVRCEMLIDDLEGAAHG